METPESPSSKPLSNPSRPNPAPSFLRRALRAIGFALVYALGAITAAALFLLAVPVVVVLSIAIPIALILLTVAAFHVRFELGLLALFTTYGLLNWLGGPPDPNAEREQRDRDEAEDRRRREQEFRQAEAVRLSQSRNNLWS